MTPDQTSAISQELALLLREKIAEIADRAAAADLEAYAREIGDVMAGIVEDAALHQEARHDLFEEIQDQVLALANPSRIYLSDEAQILFLELLDFGLRMAQAVAVIL